MTAKPVDEIAADNSFSANSIAAVTDSAPSEFDPLADKHAETAAAVAESARIAITVREGTQVLVDGIVYGGGESVDAPDVLAAEWVRDGYASYVEVTK